jgi:hypothetical protein
MYWMQLYTLSIATASSGGTSDTLDLQDIQFNNNSASWSFLENQNGSQSVLTVKDTSSDVANITLLGQYLAGGQSASSSGLNSALFQLAGDNTTGTLVHTTYHA